MAAVKIANWLAFSEPVVVNTILFACLFLQVSAKAFKISNFVWSFTENFRRSTVGYLYFSGAQTP